MADTKTPELYDEWADEDLSGQDNWSLEHAVGIHEAADEESLRDYTAFVDTLDERLSDDVGYIGTPENIELLARMFIEDKPNYLRVLDIARSHRVIDLVKRAVRSRARQLSNVQAVPGGGEALSMTRIRHEIQDAPVHDDAVVPASWILDGTAGGPRRYRLIKKIVRKRDGDLVEDYVGVAYNPLVISATMIDVSDAGANLRVSWRARGQWRHKVVPRQKLCQPRELIDALSGTHGFPANANNAKDLVAYIADYEAFNEEVIPVKPMTTQMGWQGKGGKLGFVAGATHVKVDESKPSVHFVGSDEGEEQLARCATQTGTMDGWAQAAKIASHFPAVELALYASLAPPLLTPLRAPNFTVDWSHKTSAGKTTTLSLAASCWGNPDPNGHDSLIASWDMTPVGFERRAAALSSLPLIVDDTKRAASYRGESVVPRIVYEISNGQGRIRGSVKGTAKTSYWRTVMLSTGEQRIIDFDKSGGTPARVVTLWGNPFRQNSSVIGQAIRKLKAGIADNHGHAGPLLVEWLVKHRGDWSDLRAEHETRTTDIEGRMLQLASGRSMDKSVIGRVAGYLATLQLTAECAHEALALPWALGDTIGDLLPVIVPATGAVDRELEALRAAVSWASANRGKFCVSEKHRKDEEPHGGWLGFWKAAATDDWEELAFFPEALREFLRKQGHEPQAIVRQWSEAGWLESVPGESRLTSRVALGGRPRLFVLKRSAVIGPGGLDGLTDEPQASLPLDEPPMLDDDEFEEIPF